MLQFKITYHIIYNFSFLIFSKCKNKLLTYNYRRGYHCFTYIKTATLLTEGLLWDLQRLVFMRVQGYDPLVPILMIYLYLQRLAPYRQHLDEMS